MRFRKYVKGYGFCHLQENLVINMVIKTASKRVIQKTAEATRHLIGNKIADKITSIDKSKEKEKIKEIEEIYIPPEKRQQIIDDLRLFWAQNVAPFYKNGISKNCKFFQNNLW